MIDRLLVSHEFGIIRYLPFLQGICTGLFASDGMISLILIQIRLYLSSLPTPDKFALLIQLW